MNCLSYFWDEQNRMGKSGDEIKESHECRKGIMAWS